MIGANLRVRINSRNKRIITINMHSKFQEMGLAFEVPSPLNPITPCINMPQHLPTAKPSFMSARPGALLAQFADDPVVAEP